MAEENRLIIRVSLDKKKTKKDFKTIERQGKRAGENIEQSLDLNIDSGLSRRLGTLSKSFLTLGAAFAGFQAIRSSISSFAEFERGLINVQKTTDASDKEIVKLGGSINDLAQIVPLTQSRLLQLATTAGQFGIRGTKNIEKFVETMGRLEFATDVAGEQGARALIRLLNVTRQGIGDIDKLGSALVSLGNTTAATESEIIESSRRIGAALGAVGGTAQEALAIGATLREIGQNAELGGTAVQRVFTKITKSIALGTKEVAVFADIIGVTTNQLKKDFAEDATLVFQRFIQGLSNLEKQGIKTAVSLDRLGFNQERQITVFNALAGNVDKLNKNLATQRKAFAENTSLLNESERAFQSLEAQLVLAGNAFTELQQTVGAKLAPSLESALDLIKSFTLSIVENIDSIVKFGRIVIIAGTILASGKIFRLAATQVRLLSFRLQQATAQMGIGFAKASFRSASALGKLGIAARLSGKSLLFVARSAKIAKAGLTLGLSLVLDAIIVQFIDLNDVIAETVTGITKLSDTQNTKEHWKNTE